ncbi:MAG: 50S ribosomal protein L5 [Chloroflexi bacterium]|nr:50S ribosomal protein L5 [Chloroflexota bacterium]|tara:strand:+ start:73411 stop:74073 length:663 start_codon:yes stop_codon:yes gene_type:complete
MTQKNKNTPKKATKTSTQKKTGAADTKWTPTIRPLPRVQSQLLEEVGPVMMREFNYSSVMEFPRLDKIVVNVGLGEALTNSRAVENTLRDIAMITGQNPVSTKAKKSIAGFKIREGMTIGVKVTLRRRRMYEFFDRLISSSLPRIRDFRGLSRNSFDGRGNYSMGITEQVIFPEIDYNSIDKMRGMQIVIGTTANSDQEGLRLLELLGMPFVRINDTQNG